MKTLLLLLNLITVNYFAQEQIINIPNRNIISLNGDWSVIINPYKIETLIIDIMNYKKNILRMQNHNRGALYELHGDEVTRWTEEFQNAIYREQISMLSKIEFLKGMSPWILYDFRSPRRSLPHIQDYFNRKGLISNDGYKKEAFYTLQKFYNKLIFSH